MTPSIFSDEAHEEAAMKMKNIHWGLRAGILRLLYDTYGVADQFGHVQPIEDVVAVLPDVEYLLREAGSWEVVDKAIHTQKSV